MSHLLALSGPRKRRRYKVSKPKKKKYSYSTEEGDSRLLYEMSMGYIVCINGVYYLRDNLPTFNVKADAKDMLQHLFGDDNDS